MKKRILNVFLSIFLLFALASPAFSQTYYETIQFRRGTAAEWLVANPVLAQGEPGFETNSGRIKFGDGLTHWNDLAYFDNYIDARSFSTLAAANTAAYNAGKTLLIASNYTLTANMSLTAAVKVIKGGGFTEASAFTLAINGPFEVGLYQIFWGFPVGNVTLGLGAVKEVHPEWWGAVGDCDPVTPLSSATNDTVAIQCAIGAGVKNTITLTRFYRVTGVNPFTLLSGQTFRGLGWHTGIWHDRVGAAGVLDSTTFKVYHDVENITFSNFLLRGRTNHAYPIEVSGDLIKILSSAAASFDVVPHDIYITKMKLMNGYTAVDVGSDVVEDTYAPWNIFILDNVFQDLEHGVYSHNMKGPLIIDGAIIDAPNLVERGLHIYNTNNVSVSNIKLRGAGFIISGVRYSAGGTGTYGSASFTNINADSDVDTVAGQIMNVSMSAGTAVIRNVAISNITCVNSTPEVLRIGGSATATIYDVVASSIRGPGQMTINYVNGVSVSASSSPKVQIANSSNVVYSGNTVSNTTNTNLILVQNVDNFTFSNNIVTSGDVGAVVFRMEQVAPIDSTNVRIENNIFKASGHTSGTNGIGFEEAGSIDGLFIRNNIFQNLDDILKNYQVVTNGYYEGNYALGAANNIVNKTAGGGTWSPDTIVAVGAGAFTVKSGNGNALTQTGFYEVVPGIWVPYVTDPTP